LSIAKKDRKGLDGERSGLFWEYVRIKNEAKPKWFILENVASMSKEAKEAITKAMGVEPVMFNASLVSAQSRKRLFWTNIPFELPEDKGVLLKHILEDNVDKKFNVNGDIKLNGKSKGKIGYIGEGEQNGQGGQAHRVYSPEGKTPTLSSFSPLIKIGNIGSSDAQANRVYSTEGKSVTLSANGGGLGAKTGLYDTGSIRKLTPIECERLQGLPDNYTEGIAMTNRYKCLGNAFNVDVVAHILAGVRK
jgi:DNA (cytosine-5)-methyltransferase 3A